MGEFDMVGRFDIVNTGDINAIKSWISAPLLMTTDTRNFKK